MIAFGRLCMEFIEEKAGKNEKLQIIALNTKTWSLYCLIWAHSCWTPLFMTWGAVLGFELKNTIKKGDALGELCF